MICAKLLAYSSWHQACTECPAPSITARINVAVMSASKALDLNIPQFYQHFNNEETAARRC